MEYFGATKKLSKILSNKRKMTKEYGEVRAERIIQRLTEFELAENLASVSHLPPSRLHRLSGNRENQFAVDIVKNWRIVFEGYDENDHLSVDKGKIVTLSILAIEDYH